MATHQCILCGNNTDDGTYHIGYRVNLPVYSLFTCDKCSTPPEAMNLDEEPSTADELLDFIAATTAYLDLLADAALQRAIEAWPDLPPGNTLDKYLAFEMQQQRRIDRARFN